MPGSLPIPVIYFCITDFLERQKKQRTKRMNISDRKHFPRWYIINDSSIVLLNLTTIVIGITFIFLVIRTRKLRTTFNILSSNSCLCGSSLALTILWDASHMLKTDISGIVQQDRTCVARPILMLITMNALNYSLCIQTYHRFISVVHCQRTSLRSTSLYMKIIILQCILAPVLSLPLILSQGFVYHTGSFVCQIPLSSTALFTYLFIVSYGTPILFITILHLCIAHYIRKHWQLHRKRGAYIVCPLQRIVLIILVLVVSIFPYGIFSILEYLHIPAVDYAQKLGMLIASLSFNLTMILIFGFNRSVRNSFVLLFHRTDSLVVKFQKSIR